MNRIETRTSRSILTASGAGLLAALLPIPPSEAYDSGAVPARALASHTCRLERVERQYVRCDNLTGAGVTAPLWLPQRP